VKICKLKIDSKGRVQLPKTFLEANEIPYGTTAYVEVIQSNSNSVRLTFIPPQA
jgi:DNA-binding transcriptional regulator/RsmH inhibitor MraZ